MWLELNIRLNWLVGISRFNWGQIYCRNIPGNPETYSVVTQSLLRVLLTREISSFSGSEQYVSVKNESLHLLSPSLTNPSVLSPNIFQRLGMEGRRKITFRETTWTPGFIQLSGSFKSSLTSLLYFNKMFLRFQSLKSGSEKFSLLLNRKKIKKLKPLFQERKIKISNLSFQQIMEFKQLGKYQLGQIR